MIALKKLVLQLDKMLSEKDISNIVLLRSLTDDALKYLKTSKTFEYTGPIKLPGVALKLVDLKMDLDDVIKEIFNKRSDIEFSGTINLIVEDEVKNEKKAT